MPKAALPHFLARNPFGNGMTDGLFYREKMRAIHRVAPGEPGGAGRPRVLDIGGGRSGLAAMLYPDAEVTTLDRDPSHGGLGPADATSSFVCGDAVALPFADDSFDLVAMFDVLEHVPEDRAAAREALRVVRPGGVILVSTPDHDWRYPHYGFMRPVCPPETDLMAEWGHVRRGYTRAQLIELFGSAPERSASFVNGLTAFSHDVAFSRLGRRARKLLYAAAAPLTALGYLAHHPAFPGAETAFAWRK